MWKKQTKKINKNILNAYVVVILHKNINGDPQNKARKKEELD